MYWPRLLRDPKDPLRSKVGVDWKRWKDEDEDENGPPRPLLDSEWLDDDLTVTKVASFPEEEYDDSLVPLLDAGTLAPYLERANLTLVLCFERAERCKGCRQLAKLLAHVASQVNEENKQLSVGRVDGIASFEVMKRLHVTSFPQLKLFFRDGDVVTVDAPSVRSSRQLQHYLVEQLQPAWLDVDGGAEALEDVLTRMERVALFVVPEDSEGSDEARRAKAAERAFEGAAKKFRAMLVKHTSMVFVKTTEATVLALLKEEEKKKKSNNNSSNSNLDDEANSNVSGLVSSSSSSSSSTGITLLALKAGEEPLRYPEPLRRHHKNKNKNKKTLSSSSSWKAKAVFHWLRKAQFKVLEQVTPNNFPEFRRKGNPMLYILLAGNDTSHHEEILDVVRPVAKANAKRLTFVYTHVSSNNTAAMDLLSHLRCDFDGETTFAVLEDFREEYRYCIEASSDRPLTFGRIERLVEGFVGRDKTVLGSPDKLRSEPVPSRESNVGPVYDVVGENLMEVVLDPTKDVVIHFYSPMDDKWDYDETELKNAAEVLEGTESVLIGKIDGFKNEKPREFPDIGYFPCTYLFPSSNKMMPIEFNKTQGFLKDRLLEWIGDHASKPEDLPEEARKELEAKDEL
ncbi:protein disulfide isomerase [Chloropicon primus]|uniref:protein disulfide-isomerase n=1 Tax=Chloropicon primus TaxID=1764295 RepID=A0A5B8MXU2_9CHLO|nr:protein disulfide isomerase [Chloropicon primus]UPR03518.1 protein disulfide isomerase [Chloropicon primus]|eukprot:QDZ24310.1 protein disulfide isomerase [Chloropicon primus]